jgi:hypothetical protein
MSFATKLDRLIHRHVGHPKCGDDFQEVVDALHKAASRVAIEADRYERTRWSGSSGSVVDPVRPHSSLIYSIDGEFIVAR